LKQFLAVSEAQSLSRAALSLGLTQSGLSRQISTLESRLNVRLFERTGRGVVLTQAGRELLPYAQSILKQAREAESRLADMRRMPSGRVVIGVTPTVAQMVTAPVIAASRERYAGISLLVMESSASVIGEWLAEGRADLGVCYAPPEQFGAALDGEKLLDDTLGLVSRVAAMSSSGDGEAISLREAARLPLILPSGANGMRKRLDAEAEASGIRLNVVMEVDSPAAIYTAVSSGVGHTVLPCFSARAEAELRRLTVRPLVSPSFPAWLSLYVARTRRTSSAVRAITELVRSRARQLERG
jgi:LysR family nitrogen assimilation transcriptional regulator